MQIETGGSVDPSSHAIAGVWRHVDRLHQLTVGISREDGALLAAVSRAVVDDADVAVLADPWCVVDVQLPGTLTFKACIADQVATAARAVVARRAGGLPAAG